MMDQELIDGVDLDPLPERLYNIKGNQRCKKCNRPLKGKIAYLTLDNYLICRDTGSTNTALEVILCNFFQSLTHLMKSHGQRLPTNAIKRIEKILKDSLE